MPKSGVRNVHAQGDKWRAQVRINGKMECGPSRDTIEDAKADLPAMLARQRESQLARRAAQLALKAERAKARADLPKTSGVKHV